MVKSTKELSDNVPKGCVGIIVYVHSGYPQAYEVEFVNTNNETLEVLIVSENDIQLYI